MHFTGVKTAQSILNKVGQTDSDQSVCMWFILTRSEDEGVSFLRQRLRSVTIHFSRSCFFRKCDWLAHQSDWWLLNVQDCLCGGVTWDTIAVHLRIGTTFSLLLLSSVNLIE